MIRWDLMRVLMAASKAYMGKGNDKTALSYALETYSIAKEAKAKPFMLEDYLLLSKLYYQNHRYDSAYLFRAEIYIIKGFYSTTDNFSGNLPTIRKGQILKTKRIWWLSLIMKIKLKKKN